MAPRWENLDGTIGDTNIFTVTEVVEGTETPVDLTGATMWFTAKNDPADADADKVFQKKTGGLGIVLTTPLSGIATVTIAPADTVALAVSTSLFYDVQLLSGTRLTTTQQGILRLQRDITRAVA